MAIRSILPILKFAILVSCVLSTVFAHSFVTCTDYRSDGSCKGYARNFVEFTRQGDGYTYRPGTSGVACDPGKQKRTGEVVTNLYSDTFPMAKATAGQTLTIEWPARNHAQPFLVNLPGLYVEIYGDPTPNLSEDPTQAKFNSNEVKKTRFDNCLPGSDNDRRCHGSIVIPSNFQTGIYSYQWWWEFNPGEFYATCFEVSVTGRGGGVVPTPPVPVPTRPRPTAPGGRTPRPNPSSPRTPLSKPSAKRTALLKPSAKRTALLKPSAKRTARPSPSGSFACAATADTSNPWGGQSGTYTANMNIRITKISGANVQPSYSVQIIGAYTSTQYPFNWNVDKLEKGTIYGTVSAGWQALTDSGGANFGLQVIAESRTRLDPSAVKVNGVTCSLTIF